MKQLQSIAESFLAKVDSLLTTEPVRLILYGAAAVLYLVARVMADHGYLNVPLTFDQSLIASGAAIGVIVIVVESARRFVVSPQTYIEDLSDAAKDAHEAAHIEEDASRLIAQMQSAAAAPVTQVVPVGSVKPAGSGEKAN